MKFIQATIYGFGKWVDKTIDFSHHDLVCFYGENESGKTTIQQFILYVLFGLPPRKLRKYQPMHSHKIGGRLILKNDQIGRFTIERAEQKVVCYLENGEEKDEAWLNTLLNGLNREVFESIYAFSALDLVQIKQMKQEEISNILFSVGLTGSTKIYEAEKNLNKKMDDLFKKTGKNPIINKQINVTQKAHENTITSQKEEAKYQMKQTALSKAQQEKMQHVNEASNLQAELLQQEKHRTLLPQLHQYHDQKAKLAELPKEQPFPENGISRLENVKTKLLPIQSELQATKNRLNQVKIEQKTYEQALYDQETIIVANELIKQKGVYEHAREQKQSLILEIQHVDKQLEEKISPIQMTEEEIDEVHLPFHLETEWEALKQTQQQLLYLEEQQTSAHHLLQEREADLTKKKTEIEKSLLPKEKMEHIQSTQNMISRSSEPQKENVDKYSWKTKQMNIARNMLIGSVVLAVITIIITILMENLLLLSIPFVILIAGILQYIQTKRTITYVRKNEKQNESNRLSFETYAKQQTILDEQNAWQTKLETINIQLDQLHQDRFNWREQQTAFLKKEHKWIEEVERTKQTYPFLHHTEVIYWLDLLTILRDVKKDLQERSHLEERLTTTINQIQNLEVELTNIASILEEDNVTFEELEAILHEQTTNERLLREWQEQQQTYESDILLLQKQEEVYLSEMQALLNNANVETENDYLQVANQEQQRTEISSSIKQIKQQLTTMLNHETLEKVLQSVKSEYELDILIQDLNEQLNKNQEQQAKLDKEITTLELEMKHLENSDDYSTAIYTEQIEVDTLQQYANEWAILKIAQSTLQQAKMNYQKTHLEDVLRHTSTFFKQLTNGRYGRVHPPTTKIPFQVEGQDHIVYTIDTLSQGTIDQLYIALRLAISVVMSDRYQMPFMIDDAFVHFDKTRTENMIRILQQLAGKQQLIVFTCKNEIASQLDSIQIT